MDILVKVRRSALAILITVLILLLVVIYFKIGFRGLFAALICSITGFAIGIFEGQYLRKKKGRC